MPQPVRRGRRRRGRQRLSRDLLLALVRVDLDEADVATLIDQADLDAVVELAEQHRVAAVIHQRLSVLGAPVPAALTRRLAQHRAAAQVRQLQAYRTIAAIQGAIDMPFLVVKGPVLAAHWYGDPSLRVYSDIDVLVARTDFCHVLDALTHAGFEQLSANWSGFLEHEVAEIPLGRGPLTVDLHWHLIGMAQPRREIHLNMAGLFERARPVAVGSTEVSTLDPEDTLLHVCVNCGLDGAQRLQQLVDVDRIARSERVDWKVFTTRAHQARAHALCAAVLQRSRDAVGTPLPPTLLSDLAPYPGWLHVNALIDGRRRTGRRLTNGLASGVVLASGRATRVATLTSAIDATRHAALIKTGRPGLTGRGGDLDWQRGSENGDDAPNRGRYLAWVATGATQLRVERCNDTAALHDLVGDVQPRATPLLGAALRNGLPGRSCRAALVRHDDGRLAAVVVLRHYSIASWTAYPLLLDASAATVVGRLIDRSSATDMAGFEPDIEVLRSLMTRWRETVVATSTALPAGSAWEDPPPATRRATPADIDQIVELTWNHASHPFANRWLLRRWARTAVADLTVVVEAGDPPQVAGYIARDSSTPEYDVLGYLMVDPAHRGAGLSWQLVAAAVAQAKARGAGSLAFVAATNPMSLPSDAVLSDPWVSVRLRPPRRFRGEPRLHRLLARLLERRPASGSEAVGHACPDRELPAYRSPGRGDDMVSSRRTQQTWNTEDARR